jgi:hypothetical protein
LVWDVALDLDTNWFNAQIDAQTGEVLGLVDWVSHAKFNVFINCDTSKINPY